MPSPLLAQLAWGGRLIAPVGSRRYPHAYQTLTVIDRDPDNGEMTARADIGVTFIPLMDFVEQIAPLD